MNQSSRDFSIRDFSAPAIKKTRVSAASLRDHRR
jgi:hypothetical protein